MRGIDSHYRRASHSFLLSMLCISIHVFSIFEKKFYFQFLRKKFRYIDPIYFLYKIYIPVDGKRTLMRIIQIKMQRAQTFATGASWTVQSMILRIDRRRHIAWTDLLIVHDFCAIVVEGNVPRWNWCIWNKETSHQFSAQICGSGVFLTEVEQIIK
jgi:hypothetical protein